MGTKEIERSVKSGERREQEGMERRGKREKEAQEARRETRNYTQHNTTQRGQQEPEPI